MELSRNAYLEYTLFTLTTTTLISVVYLNAFKIKTHDRYIDRILRIFLAMTILFFIMKKIDYSIDKIYQVSAVFFIILYILIYIKSVIDYFRFNEESHRGKALKILGLTIGLFIIIAFRESLMIEITNVFNFNK